MANDYHDQYGRFCARGKMLSDMKRAITTGDAATWIRLKEDLTKADQKTGYLPSKRNGLIHPAVADLEGDIEERDRILASGDTEAIQNYVDDRTSNEKFVELLDERDVMKARARVLVDEYKLLESQHKAGIITDYEVVREKGFEAQDAYEEFLVLKNQANDYKDITAIAAARLSDSITEDQVANGTWNEYTENTLNDLVETGEFPSGSREWLEQRQKGIGGSDVGKIIGVNDESGLNRSDFHEVLGSKLDTVSDEEVEEQAAGHSEFSGYAGRGNAWEMLIAQKFASNNPDSRIAHCKSSWQNKNNTYQFANFDGLMTDENGHPNGILEIKTASDATKWGDPKDGLDAVPAGYRAQTLWYADAAGFDKGAIAVMIDDREYREYHFKVTPELREEMQRNREQVAEFVETVDKIKKGELPDPRVPKDNTGREHFGPTMLMEARQGKDKAFKEASIIREESLEATKARFKELCADPKDKEQVKKALWKLYSEKPVSERKRKIIAIDLETSSSQPTRGHIIEVGVSVRDPQGGEEQKISKLYGLSKRALAAQGTGSVEVHGISEGMIAKKRQFRHKEEQAKLLAVLKSGIIVPHNAGFERGWFRQHLDGFAAAEDRGEIQILDTMVLTRKLLPETPNWKLKSLVEHYGMEYKNAHRAYNDADMTAIGLENLLKDISTREI